ncbi:MAG: hypothetical protein R3F17_15900 [Planctomycetota bacterium]
MKVIPTVTALAGGGYVTSVTPAIPDAFPRGFRSTVHRPRHRSRTRGARGPGPCRRGRRSQDLRDAPGQPAHFATLDQATSPLRRSSSSLAARPRVKDGVPLFRLAGPAQFAGTPAGIRLGFGVFAAFAGTDAQARAHVDWTVRSSELVPLLDNLGHRGYFVESLNAAAPASTTN